MSIPKITDEQYQDIFQIGVTPEMLGVKMIDETTLENVKVKTMDELIYNEAIEAAANKAEANGAMIVAMEIRKMKK